jgi:lysine 6-dehydrogenase
MKILALGGCGGMGKIAVQTAVNFDNVTEIIVADRNFEAAKTFSSGFSNKVTPAAVDALDSNSLDELMKTCDVVVSTIGPFYLFGTKVLESAIRTKTHYIDICDDWEPTQAMLELHQQAEDAGITAIIGAGASPGVSNLLAVKAITELETPEEVYTFWGSGGPINQDEGDLDLANESGEPSAATIHWIQQLSGTIQVLENNQLTTSKPLRPVTIDYPGIGSDLCHICGHPEPISLARYYPTIKQSYNLMNMPSFIIYALEKSVKDVRDGNSQDVKEAAQKLCTMLANETIGALDTAKYLYYLVKDKNRNFLPPMGALAVGTDSTGSRVSVATHLEATAKVDDMAHQTCIPTAIILKMLTDGVISKRGVLAPEACVDPDIFFTHLRPYLDIHQGFDETNFVKVSKEFHTLPI